MTETMDICVVVTCNKCQFLILVGLFVLTEENLLSAALPKMNDDV